MKLGQEAVAVLEAAVKMVGSLADQLEVEVSEVSLQHNAGEVSLSEYLDHPVWSQVTSARSAEYNLRQLIEAGS